MLTHLMNLSVKPVTYLSMNFYALALDAHILVLKGQLMYFHFQMILVQLVQHLKVMEKMTLFSLLLGSVQESAYTM